VGIISWPAEELLASQGGMFPQISLICSSHFVETTQCLPVTYHSLNVLRNNCSLLRAEPHTWEILRVQTCGISIGQRYAMLLMKPILCTMQRQYKVTRSLRMADILLRVDILLKLVHGFPVALEPRSYCNRLSEAVRHIYSAELPNKEILDHCPL